MDDGTLLCVELGRRTVDRVHPDGRVEVVSENGGSPNGIAIGPTAWCPSATAVVGLSPRSWARITSMHQPAATRAGASSGSISRPARCRCSTASATGTHLMGPNDVFSTPQAACGSPTTAGPSSQHDQGCSTTAPDGSSISEVIYPLESPNGIGSPDGKRSTSPRRPPAGLWSWAVTAPGEIAPAGPVGNGGTPACRPPGFQLFRLLRSTAKTSSSERSSNGGLTIVSPDGSSVDHVALPDFMITNVCFGGDDLRTAYVTCSATGTILSFPWPRPGLKLAY